MASRKVTSSGKRESARRPRRVVVAMSGGVDSSVVAALLEQQGCEVVGVTLQLYDHGEAVGRRGACCAGQDIHDARRVADRLGIPHYVLDYEQRFKTTVMQSFAESYVAGETPVPCVVCNQQIKFHELLATVRELEADALATGHYIQLRAGPAGPELCRARDAERDQSYFLFATTRAQLDWLLFPLGAYRKAEVRALARQFALPVADKSDSQDICFVPQGRYTNIIERLKPVAAAGGHPVPIGRRSQGAAAGRRIWRGRGPGLRILCRCRRRSAGAGRRMDRARAEPRRAAGDGGGSGRRDGRNYRACYALVVGTW